MRPTTAPENDEELDDRLSEPSAEAIAALAKVPGDLLIFGVAGKMGPSLARMARRASEAAGHSRRIIGVARFTQGGEAALQRQGIETIRCDLLDEAAVARLPRADNVLMMTGMKFGATSNEGLTWAMNCYLPGRICHHFCTSRIVAFSTGNVYGLVPVSSGGSRETDGLVPQGEYAMSCVGRERMLDFSSRTYTIPMAIIRLNYACDLRYGVVVDIARRIVRGEPVDVSMGYFNTIWQGDANAMTLAAFEHLTTPPHLLNVTGTEVLSVREVAQRMAYRMQRNVQFIGSEATTALLNNASYGQSIVGRPRVATEQLIEWVADWTNRGGAYLGKPTHFESRDGKF